MPECWGLPRNEPVEPGLFIIPRAPAVPSADRPALPEPGGGGVMFPVPDRGPVEDFKPVGLVGTDRGKEQFGKLPLWLPLTLRLARFRLPSEDRAGSEPQVHTGPRAEGPGRRAGKGRRGVPARLRVLASPRRPAAGPGTGAASLASRGYAATAVT